MNDGLIPGRYAKALLEFAAESDDNARIYSMMHTLDNSMAAQPALRKVLANPFVQNDDKIHLLATAAGAKADDPVFNRFVNLLVKNNRIDLMREIAIAYMQLYRKVNNIYLVHVTSAAPLSPADENRLKTLIESHLKGAKMEYSSDVDPELIGGFVVTINNEKLDASVADELRQLRQKLLSN
ncbi:MAG: F0F1 ATP synthase subunit delta [Lachnoclostridium sp.]|nr:F0F1 ATP synthase subunit delta [Lachnoclostridium sp.]